MKRSYLTAAIVLAACSVVWIFGIGRRWAIRIPRDHVSNTTYFGTQTNADPKTGVVPEQDALATYDRAFRVIDDADWPRSLVVRNQYTARDITTGAVNFEYITNERIDPQTGAWASGPHKGDIVFFPRSVQKRTYTIRSNYLPGLPLKFTKVDDVGGLETYLFTYRGPVNFTAAFAGTPQSPGVKVSAGQEIRCADEQFYYRVWVEPRTGREVRVEEGCLSGDFIYDKATGNKVAAVDRWNGVTGGSSLAAVITDVYDARRTYMWATFYVPGILILCSLGIVAAGLLRRETMVPA